MNELSAIRKRVSFNTGLDAKTLKLGVKTNDCKHVKFRKYGHNEYSHNNLIIAHNSRYKTQTRRYSHIIYNMATMTYYFQNVS